MSTPDLKVDSSGDVILSNGDLAQVTGDEAILQGIRIALQTYKGEWFLNTNFGLDYDLVFSRTTSPGQKRREIRRVVMEVPGVVSVLSMQAGRDLTDKRQLNIAMTIQTENSASIPVTETINA